MTHFKYQYNPHGEWEDISKQEYETFEPECPERYRIVLVLEITKDDENKFIEAIKNIKA